jgi:NAD(P)-dependent dehydrogenase (short-subunit alcohol dehydrogenase family)
MKFNNKTVLITGAGQGMGQGVARYFASEGALLLVNDIDVEKANATVALIESDGGKAHACAFDVTDYSAVEQAVNAAEAAHGGIDILINNAGNAGHRATHQIPFKDMPVEEWDWYIGVNLFGVMNCTRAVLPGMCERKWGRVIQISSEAGRVGLEINVSVYGAAKAGAAHLMRHIAKEVGPDGVTANIVSLGLMDNVPEEFTSRIVKTIPTRRLGTHGDVAAAAAYLASEEASWVTGQTIAVNGGVNGS